MPAEGMNKPGTVRDAGIEPQTGQMQPQPPQEPTAHRGRPAAKPQNSGDGLQRREAEPVQA